MCTRCKQRSTSYSCSVAVCLATCAYATANRTHQQDASYTTIIRTLPRPSPPLLLLLLRLLQAAREATLWK
jgi:hypothetical protein